MEAGLCEPIGRGNSQVRLFREPDTPLLAPMKNPYLGDGALGTHDTVLCLPLTHMGTHRLLAMVPILFKIAS